MVILLYLSDHLSVTPSFELFYPIQAQEPSSFLKFSPCWHIAIHVYNIPVDYDLLVVSGEHLCIFTVYLYITRLNLLPLESLYQLP